MPSKDPKAYALSEKGSAARSRARAKWLAKRKGLQAPSHKSHDAQALLNVIQKWSRP